MKRNHLTLTFLKTLLLTCLVLSTYSQAWAQQGGNPFASAEMIQAQTMDPKHTAETKSKTAILIAAYNERLKTELKKTNPDRERINRWYMEQASQILNLDAETSKFFKEQLEIINPKNPFLYRSKEGKNYLAFPALQNGRLAHGSIMPVEEHFNAQQKKVNFIDTLKASANPKHVQFFPREYIRFMAVSYAVTWEMCRVKWSSVKSILSFESAYRDRELSERKDPLCDEHFIKSLQDPIGWLGFYAFIMANHNLAPRVSNFMFKKLGRTLSNSKLPFLQKRIQFLKFFTNIVAGGIGMTAGLTASDYVHQLKENPNLKACFRYSEQAGFFGQYCQEAYKDFLLLNSGPRDRMAISTMSLLSAFGLNTLAQIPLQLAVHGVRAGLNTALTLTLGVALGPAGWAVGAILYVGSTYLFLRFDHMVSPHIEKFYYGVTKPRAVRNSLNELVDAVKKQSEVQWQQPLTKSGAANDDECLVKQSTNQQEEGCKPEPILIDEALRNFSLAMSEHRNLNILSGVSSKISIWQSKWSGFYHNYKGSMGLIDLLAYYRREYKSRLQSIDFMKQYGYDPEKRSSIDIFAGVFNPLYGFEEGLLDSSRATSDIDHERLVRMTHLWIKQAIRTTDSKFKRGARSSMSYTHHLKPHLISLLEINDPLILGKELLKAQQMIQHHNSFFVKDIYDMLHKRFTPIFPFHRSYFGSSNPVEVPILEEYSNFNEETQAQIREQRRQLKCSEEGSLDGEGACSLTPQEVLELEESAIPMIAKLSANLGYEIASGERFNFVENIAGQDESGHPDLFDPNCYTFNFFGTNNPTCWWTRNLKDSQGKEYTARFKTPLLSDYLLANMACGISNRAYISTSGGPKNLLGSETYFNSEGFSAQFIPPNLIKGAPACTTGRYNFGKRFQTTSDTYDLHRSFIKIKKNPTQGDLNLPPVEKEYYGALNLILDPSNPWVFGDSVESITNYWNSQIFPAAKNIATTLYKDYQKVVSTELLPLFNNDMDYVSLQNPVSGSNQPKNFSDLYGGTRPTTTPAYRNPYRAGSYNYYSSSSASSEAQETLTTDNLRENFMAQARLYLLLLKEVSGDDLKDEAIEDLLKTLNQYITAITQGTADYNLEGQAFLQSMKTKLDYHDNIMERRSRAMFDKYEQAFDNLGSLEWFNDQEKAKFMGQMNSPHMLNSVPLMIQIRVLELFEKNKIQRVAADDPEPFGYDNIELKQALLFYQEDQESTIESMKTLYAQFISEDLSLEQLFEQLEEQTESGQLKLVFAKESDLFKEWMIARVKNDIFGLLSELKGQYYSEWIHGSKFYLNNLQLSE